MTHARLLRAERFGDIEAAAARLREGELVAFPTDTVYGVGANAFNAIAVSRIYAVKGRPQDKGIPVLLAEFSDLRLVAEHLSEAAWKLAQAFWPGGLTIVVMRRPELPEAVSQTPTVAVRIPDHPIALALIRTAGFPLAATSANRSGEPAAISAREVDDMLGERISCILDGGAAPGGIASTLVDCSVDPPRLLRRGALPVEELRKVVPEIGEQGAGSGERG